MRDRIVIFVMVVCLLAACSGVPAATNPTTAPAEANASTPVAAPAATTDNATTVAESSIAAEPDLSGFPVTIENCGRTLTFEKPPERVLTTYPAVTDLLLRLGLGDKIIGSAWHTTVPPAPDIAAEYNQLPNQFEEAVNREKFFDLQPDFVLSGFDLFDFNAQQGQAGIEEVQAAGIEVYSMTTECHNTPELRTTATVSMIYDDIRAIGAIFGIPERAEQLVVEMQERINTVQAKIKDRPLKPSVIYCCGEGPLVVYSNGLYGDILRLAGGTSIFADFVTDNWGEVSAEEMATRNPELFVISDIGPEFEKKSEYLFTTFPNTPAGRDRRSVRIDDVQVAAGFRVVEAIEAIAPAMHPEAFQ